MLMRLSHPHVLPFRGVDTTLSQVALVYDWGENDDIIKYIASHPEASKKALVRATIPIIDNRVVTDTVRAQ